MSAGRAVFITGIVIGTTSGLALGHLTIWNRASHAPAEARVSLPPSDLPGLQLPESDVWDSLSPWPRSSEVYYAPVSDARSQEKTTLPIDVSPPTGELPPPSLLPLPDASPIGAGVDFDLRAVIARELPEATEAQMNVWLQVLEGLSEEDAIGILRVWQMHGEWPPSVSPLNEDLPALVTEDGSSELVTPPFTTDDVSDAPEQAVLDQLRAITLHNIANAETLGYRSLTPVVSNLAFPPQADESDGAIGIRLERVTLSIEAGEFIATGEQWDVAIRHQPCVFFKVQDGGTVALTRYGHLELDGQQRLCIAANGKLWPLEPQLTVPEGTAFVRIEADGRLQARDQEAEEFTEVGSIALCQVHSPRSLEPMGDRLYRVTDATSISAPLASFELAQGFLEGSNVILAIERSRLAWLDELLLLRQ